MEKCKSSYSWRREKKEPKVRNKNLSDLIPRYNFFIKSSKESLCIIKFYDPFYPVSTLIKQKIEPMTSFIPVK